MAASTDRRVFSWGYGEDGQLGHGNTDDQLVPTEIQYFRKKNVTLIDCGHSHSGAICDGEVYMWGINPDGRLMMEANQDATEPTLTLMSEL